MIDKAEAPMKVGDAVRERGYEHHVGKVVYVTSDGWIGVRWNNRHTLSHRPIELIREGQR